MVYCGTIDIAHLVVFFLAFNTTFFTGKLGEVSKLIHLSEADSAGPKHLHSS